MVMAQNGLCSNLKASCYRMFGGGGPKPKDAGRRQLDENWNGLFIKQNQKKHCCGRDFEMQKS